jgi:hypothetical protein
VLASEKLHNPLSVPEPRCALLPGLGEALAGQFTNGLNEVEARRATHYGAHDQVLFDERGEPH